MEARYLLNEKIKNELNNWIVILYIIPRNINYRYGI